MTDVGRPPEISSSARATRYDAGWIAEGAREISHQLSRQPRLRIVRGHRDSVSEYKIRNSRVTRNLAVVDRALLDTIQRLLQAELELADKSEQRVAVIEKHVSSCRMQRLRKNE